MLYITMMIRLVYIKYLAKENFSEEELRSNSSALGMGRNRAVAVPAEFCLSLLSSRSFLDAFCVRSGFRLSVNERGDGEGG